MGLGTFVHEWRDFFRFRALPPESRAIVFYAEDASSWKHFQRIVSELVGGYGKQICYITSSVNDPLLQGKHDEIDTFYIGMGCARTVFFLSLSAKVMVMTMPDLETSNIKRSKNPVHYVYVFHSLVSTHMIYRQGAFNNFDTVFCVGPHQINEIRATESYYGLRPKNLVEAGYGLLDSILSSGYAEVDSSHRPSGDVRRVLVAPSWGPNALLETCGTELIELLLGAGYHTTVRPHSMTLRQNPKLLAKLRRQFDGNPNFAIDLDIGSQGTVQACDLMISDWSGAALEFAFGLERPVLYIDVPKKVNNQEYQKIPCVPIEVKLRSEIGAIVAPDQLWEAPHLVEELCSDSSKWSKRIKELRSEWVYNVGNSGAVGARYIANVSAAPDVTDLEPQRHRSSDNG